MKADFRKFYFRMEEKDYGTYIPSVIVYSKMPFMYTTKVLSDEEAKKKGYQVEAINTHFKYSLQIDLWFVILRFYWQDKVFKHD